MADLSLLQDFVTETTEHLEEMERCLLTLDAETSEPEVLNGIFRSVHTIKGSAEYIGLARIAELTHRLENLLDLLRQGKKSVTPEIVDLLIASHDRIGFLVQELESEENDSVEIEDLLSQIEAAADGGPPEKAAPSGDPERIEAVRTEETECYQEQYDRELFAIFLEQLKKGLATLEAEGQQLVETATPVETLDRCIGQVEALWSSANYMGYDRALAVYEGWKEALVQAREKSLAGAAIDWGRFRQAGIDGPAKILARLFPLSEADASSGGESDGGLELEVEEIESLMDDILGEEDAAEAAGGPDPAAPATEDTAGVDTAALEGPDLSLIEDFVSETHEQLEELEQHMVGMATAGDDPDLLNAVFRSVHTIKGAAEYVGVPGIASLSHRLESLLDALRRIPGAADPLLVETLIAARDRIAELVRDLSEAGAEQRGIEDILEQIDAAAARCKAAALPPADPDPARDGEAGSDAKAEVYAEEYDAELFSIFLEQLREGLDALKIAAADLGRPESAPEAVNRSLDTLAALSGSSNYMGYDRAIRIYDRLTEELRRFAEQLARGGSPDGDRFVRELVEEGIRQVHELFPKLGPSTGPGMAASEPEPRGGEAEKEEPYAAPEPGDAGEAGENPLFSRLESAFDEMTRDFGRGAPAGEAGSFTAELFSDAAEPASGGTAPGPGAEKAGFDALFTPAAAPDGPTSTGEPMPDSETGHGAATPVEAPVPPEPLPVSAPKTEAAVEAPPAAPAAGASEEAVEEEELAEKALPFVEDPGRRSPKSLGRRSTDKFAEKMLKQSVRVDAKKIDVLINQVGELVVNRAYFSQLYHEMKQLQQHLQSSVGLDQKDLKQVKAFTFRLSEATVALGRAANELQEGVMRIRMLPIAQLFNRYPRLVHDLVKGSEKKVHLEIHGEETELDKMIIEEISDPMIHIIRNAVDHGIETAAGRLAAGKPETGTIKLEAYHESNHVVVEISDDGRGIDIERIKATALEKDLYSKEELDRMTSREITSLVLRPGFSTASRVTHTSGRGVGMDVVKKNIEKLNGTLEVESDFGIGTRIRLKIPLTLAIIPALLVEVSGDLFTIPLSTVDETIRVDEDELTTIEGVEVLQFREGTLPIVRLTDVFNMPEQDPSRRRHFVVVVSSGMKQMGIIVDRLIGQEEVVIKPLEDYLQENSGFSGATILGDGRISLILDIYELITLTVEKQARRQNAGAAV